MEDFFLSLDALEHLGSNFLVLVGLGVDLVVLVGGGLGLEDGVLVVATGVGGLGLGLGGEGGRRVVEVVELVGHWVKVIIIRGGGGWIILGRVRGEGL